MANVNNESKAYIWGSLFNLKAISHYVIAGLFFWGVYEVIYWWNLEDEIQLPKVCAGAITAIGLLFFEWFQTTRSKGTIDLTDISTGIAGIITAWIII